MSLREDAQAIQPVVDLRKPFYENSLLGSRSDATVVARLLIFETRSRAKMAAILVRFAILQRGIKIQGFDQIQKLFRRNTHQSMKIFLGEKKNYGLR